MVEISTMTMTIRVKMVSVGVLQQVSRLMGLMSKTELCDEHSTAS